MYLQINDIRVYTEIYGSRVNDAGQLVEDGPVVIAVPGGPGFSHTFLKPGLNPVAETFPLVYYDPRGVGKTDTADQSTWTLEQFADDLVGLIEALGIENAYIYAHSGGGPTAAIAMQKSAKIKGLVMAAGIIADKAQMFKNFIALGGEVAKKVMVELDLSALPAYMEQVIPLYDPIPRPPEHAMTLEGNFEQCMHMLHRAMEPKLLDRLQAVEQPVHFIVGQLDPLNPAKQAVPILEARARNNYSWQVFEQSGHDTLLCEPEKTIEVILEFVEKTSEARPQMSDAVF